MNEIEEIRSKIHIIRGQQVMLDFDLAELYGVEARVLNQSVKRNIKRFPEDFMFQLNIKEWEFMSSQFVTTSRMKRPKSSPPYAFTEQGVAMLSSVLRSDTAIEVNIRIMRTFVAVRQYLAAPKCNNCQLEGEVMRLAAYIEEVLADQNDQNEYVNRKIEVFENAIAMLQTAVFSDEPEPEDDKPKRVFNMEVKGFKKEEE